MSDEWIVSGDVIVNILDMIVFRPISKDELKTAVDMWCGRNRSTAERMYGHITYWNTVNH